MAELSYPDNMVISKTAVSSDSGPGRWASLLRRLAGQRLVDLPIRAYAVIFVITILTSPMALESDEPLYLVLHSAMLLLMLLAPFFPFSAGIAAGILSLVFLTVYPEFLNRFDAPLFFAAAVLLAQWRWRASLVITGVNLGLAVYSQFVQGELALPFRLFFYQFAMTTAFALTGAVLERRVRRETDRRVAAAVDHERKLQRLRVALYTDMHDTVSHSLATQAAMLRLLIAEEDEAEHSRILARLSTENDHARYQLREALTKIMRSEERATLPVSPSEEIRLAVESLRDSAEAAGYRVSVSVGELPDELPSELLDDALQALRELVANMLRHTSDPAACRVAVAWSTVDAPALVLVSTNPAERPPSRPLSLAARAAARGGSATARFSDGTVEVAVRFPLDADLPRTEDVLEGHQQLGLTA